MTGKKAVAGLMSRQQSRNNNVPPSAFQPHLESNWNVCLSEWGDWSDWDNSSDHTDWDDQSDGPR